MVSQRKKIFILTSRFPYPLEKGDKLRIYHQIKELSKSNDVILSCLTRKNISLEWKNELLKYCTEIHVFKLNSFLVYWNTFKMLFSHKPFQIGYFYQKNIHKRITELIERTKPNVLYCQLIRTAEYIKDIHSIPKTIDYMDALSAGMERRASITKSWFKYVIKLEGKRLKMYENKIFDYFDNHTIISSQDQSLINHPQNKSIVIVPNGIDNYFIDYDTNKISKEFDLVFVGNLNYPPNVESCDFIVNQILPYFKKRGILLSVLLSGAEPSPRVLKLSEIDDVKVSGWVDDIRESYCKGRVFIAPLFIGTGLQNKLLEAMSLCIPSVTTSLVNNALGANDNQHLLIADSLEEFYLAINSLLEDTQKSKDISEKAKDFVKSRYNWKSATAQIPL